jgi:hypothetical protein
MTTKEKIEAAAKDFVSNDYYDFGLTPFHVFLAGAEFGIALEKAKAEKLVELIKLRWPRYIESPISESIELVERTSFLAAMKLVEDYESEEG